MVNLFQVLCPVFGGDGSGAACVYGGTLILELQTDGVCRFI